MVNTASKPKRIDGDSHFFPPVNFTDVADILGVSQPALERLLGDSALFADREARRGGFKSSTAGQGIGAVNPTAATTQQGRGPVGHGVAQHRVGLLPETGFDMQVLIPDGVFANAFGSPASRDWDPGLCRRGSDQNDQQPSHHPHPHGTLCPRQDRDDHQGARVSRLSR